MRLPILGEEQLDKDHTDILFYLAQLDEMPSNFYELIHMLVDYVTAHFMREEAVMKKCNFPQLEEHRQSHKDIRLIMGNHVLKLQHDSDEFKKETVYSIKVLIETHIATHDAALARFLVMRQ